MSLAVLGEAGGAQEETGPDASPSPEIAGVSSILKVSRANHTVFFSFSFLSTLGSSAGSVDS